jgi:hypothetical protein
MERDSDSVKSKGGDDEKNVGDTGKHENTAVNDIPDPDAGLSDEERKKIVGKEAVSFQPHSTDTCAGQETCPQIGLHAYPMALLPLLDQLPWYANILVAGLLSTNTSQTVPTSAMPKSTA